MADWEKASEDPSFLDFKLWIKKRIRFRFDCKDTWPNLYQLVPREPFKEEKKQRIQVAGEKDFRGQNLEGSKWSCYATEL